MRVTAFCAGDLVNFPWVQRWATFHFCLKIKTKELSGSAPIGAETYEAAAAAAVATTDQPMMEGVGFNHNVSPLH